MITRMELNLQGRRHTVNQGQIRPHIPGIQEEVKSLYSFNMNNTNNTLMLLKLITGGHPTLSFKDNLNVVNLVQEYIFSTKRF